MRGYSFFMQVYKLKACYLVLTYDLCSCDFVVL